VALKDRAKTRWTVQLTHRGTDSGKALLGGSNIHGDSAFLFPHQFTAQLRQLLGPKGATRSLGSPPLVALSRSRLGENR
jgi:hypothetical protein